MKYIFLFVFVFVLALPGSAHADFAKITSFDAIASDSATIHFSQKEFASKRVKGYVYIRWNTTSDSKSPRPKTKIQKIALTLDQNGNGSAKLHTLQSDRSYSVSMYMKQVKPHIKWGGQSKWVKFRTAR